MQASISWPFNQTQIHLEDPETEAYARWCFEHFSPMAIEVLRETTWFFIIKSNSWLNPSIARIFGYHIEQMQARMHMAIEKGELRARIPPNLKNNEQAAVIGAAICEMLEYRALDGSKICNTYEVERHKQLSA
ncbi:hypothetical protein P886_2417 [Alteromonadaceae bacterium 2753L.S.0a.02]|nr:hypothetical protein P886_2417 [Alteromonadaceae bacterium 2753L.S.0a.02]